MHAGEGIFVLNRAFFVLNRAFFVLNRAFLCQTMHFGVERML